MNFYKYHQSNPGGVYDTNAPSEIYVQAPSAQVADEIAESYGAYFDGIALGRDCECCNDRWYRASNWDIVELKEVPSACKENRIVVHFATELSRSLT